MPEGDGLESIDANRGAGGENIRTHSPQACWHDVVKGLS